VLEELTAGISITARHGEPQGGLSSAAAVGIGTHDRRFEALLRELLGGSLKIGVGTAHDNDGFACLGHIEKALQQ